MSYTVIFNSNGGSEIDYIHDMAPGSEISKPNDPIKDGYIFKDWFEDEQLLNSWNFMTDKITNNLTLYAKWRLIEFDPPSKITNVFQEFDWSHNVIISWKEPSDDDFTYVKIYENGVYKNDLRKRINSFTVSSFDVNSVSIKTIDDLNNVSDGVS